MMKYKASLYKRCLSVVLILSIVASLLSGCTKEQSTIIVQANETANLEIDTEKIVESTVAEIIEQIANDEPEKQSKIISTKWEDYQGDLEVFTCGLIADTLKYKYDVFPAYTVLQNGISVYGIAYTDYENCYTNDDESLYCFETGFIPFSGEIDIPDEDFDSGLPVYDLDYIDEKASFIWAYTSEPFTEHCVVYNQYVKYGVNTQGQFFYETSSYTRGECDESLGTLYSYDASRYVFDNEFGQYINITGNSLYSLIDYKELEAEINRALETQDANMFSVDVRSCAYIAQEAVISYLLSMQEETFLGYSVQELVAASNQLDPMECFRFTIEGPMANPFTYDGGASSLTKWIVGTTCLIVTAVAMVGQTVTNECPFLSALNGAIAGTAIEIFMQVVISGEQLDNINWNRVVLSAVSGAVSGYINPYVAAITDGIGYFLLDSVLDGLNGGMEQAILAWMEGEEAGEIIKKFGYGFALGFAISAAFKGIGEVAEIIAKKVSPQMAKTAEKIFPKFSAKVSEGMNFVSINIRDFIITLKKAADSTCFHSEYISRKLAQRQLERLAKEGADELLENAIKNLGVNDIVDSKGKSMSKESLKQLIADADNDTVVAYFKKGDELINIVKKNGMVGIEFDSSKYQTVILPRGIVDNRAENFADAARILKKQWMDDTSSIPESISKAIKNSGIELEDMGPEKLVDIIQKSDWVLHENIDMKTITLVPRTLHKEIRHMGGFGLAKYVKSHMGIELMDRFISAAATGVVIATQ